MEVQTIKNIDKFIGTPACLLLGMINKLFFYKRLRQPKRILIIQFWGIGETILTLPAIKALRNVYKDAEINILATDRVKDVFEGHDFFDSLINIKTNPKDISRFMLSNFRKYDLVIDFEEYLNISSIISFFTGKYRIGYNNRIRGLTLSKAASYNSNQHVVETHLDLIRLLHPLPKADHLEKLHYSEKDREFIENYLKKNNISKPFIVICPGAAESARSRIWPLENYAELADSLIAKNKKIIFVGTKKESDSINKIISLIKQKEANVINSAGRLSLKQLFYLEEIADLVISNDSGPMHIGAAMQARTIGLFGPNLPVRWAPFNKKSAAIYKGDICQFSPCINVHLGKVPECLQPDHDNICMKNIKVSDVLNKIKE